MLNFHPLTREQNAAMASVGIMIGLKAANAIFHDTLVDSRLITALKQAAVKNKN